MNERTDFPSEMLAKAREAVRTSDFSTALELYEWFFDHALDGDSASYYGVRLSYCLDEWNRLGQVFEPAKIQLEIKFRHSLAEFTRTRDPERFHDYVSIGSYISRDELPIAQFLELHNSDRALAKEIVRFIWDILVEAGHLRVCGEYLDDPNPAYNRQLEIFDVTMEMCESEPELGGFEFAAHNLERYRKGVTQLVEVLNATDRCEDARAISMRAESDCKARGHAGITFN